MFTVTDESGVLADKRFTSIRQQSDQFCSVLGSRKLKIEKLPHQQFIVDESNVVSKHCKYAKPTSTKRKLCNDGKIINKIYRYVFTGQYYDPDQHFSEQVMWVKLFLDLPKRFLMQSLMKFVACIRLSYFQSCLIRRLITVVKTREYIRRVDFILRTVGHDITCWNVRFMLMKFTFIKLFSLLKERPKIQGNTGLLTLLEEKINPIYSTSFLVTAFKYH